MNKRCPKCGIVKDVQEFNLCAGRKGGFGGHCKACKSEYYFANRDRILADVKRRSKTNSARIAAYRNGPASYNICASQLSFAEIVAKGKDGELLIPCTYCGKIYAPSNSSVRNRIAVLKGIAPGEQRLYCSEACKQACPSYNQEKFWKSQKKATSREVSAHFRQLVLERDNWICQRCGAGIEAGLHVHHIEGAVQQPGIANDLENGITLCKECHKYVHSQDGCRYHDLKCSD